MVKYQNVFTLSPPNWVFKSLYTLYIRNNIVTNNLVRTLWALVKERF